MTKIQKTIDQEKIDSRHRDKTESTEKVSRLLTKRHLTKKQLTTRHLTEKQLTKRHLTEKQLT